MGLGLRAGTLRKRAHVLRRYFPLARPIFPPTIPRSGGTLLGLPGTQGSRTVHEMHIEVCTPVVCVPGGSFRN